MIKVVNQKQKQLELLTATTTPQQAAHATSKSQLVGDRRSKPANNLKLVIGRQIKPPSTAMSSAVPSKSQTRASKRKVNISVGTNHLQIVH